MLALRIAIAAVLLGLSPCIAQERKSVVVASKSFTESVVLAELIAQMLEEHSSLEVARRHRLAGTMLCHRALESGEIDIYAEYTGTAWAVILGEETKITDPLRAFLHVQRRYREEFDVLWLEPFGLNNTYALAMREKRAEELGVRSISDLVAHAAKLQAGFGVEFAKRADGYPGLAQTYGLTIPYKTLEHGLAYEAIESGALDVIDAYSTDGKLLRYELRVLEDDRAFFPPYNAAPLVRRAILRAHPEVEGILARLAYRIPDDGAQALNFVVESDGASAANVARAFLELEGLVDGKREAAAEARRSLERVLKEKPSARARSKGRPGFFALLRTRASEILRLLLEHLALTTIAILLATLVAIPLGIWITGRAWAAQVVLGVVGIVQTIPSLALLAIMIPILGLNVKAAIAALFLYAILPILRNTYTGITEVDPDLVDAAKGLGMRPRQILRRVQLPLAARTILAGIRTATVITVGFATLAAFIGAGGLGEAIFQGLTLNDSGLILLGAMSAALLAVFADLTLGLVERRFAPPGRA